MVMVMEIEFFHNKALQGEDRTGQCEIGVSVSALIGCKSADEAPARNQPSALLAQSALPRSVSDKKIRKNGKLTVSSYATKAGTYLIARSLDDSSISQGHRGTLSNTVGSANPPSA